LQNFELGIVWKIIYLQSKCQLYYIFVREDKKDSLKMMFVKYRTVVRLRRRMQDAADAIAIIREKTVGRIEPANREWSTIEGEAAS